MRIGAVGINSGDRRARRDHSGIMHTSEDKLLHSIFSEMATLATESCT